MGDLRGVDANLLVVLDAVLRERSIARASESTGLTPSAVSGAIAKLRKLLDDQLLVRTGQSSELTPRARELQPLVGDALAEVARTFGLRPTFDPATSNRRFSLQASDYVLATMTSPLLGLLREEAPGTSIDFRSLSNVDPVDLLRDDVVIAGGAGQVPGKRQSLFSDNFVCLVDAANPRLQDNELSLDDLGALPYLRVSLAPHVVTFSDDSLAAAGVTPRVAMTTGGFVTVPFLLAGTDMFGFVPNRIADLYKHHLGLAVATTTLPRSLLIETAFWHPSRSSDPALRWLVRMLRRAAELVEFGVEDEGFEPGRHKPHR